MNKPIAPYLAVGLSTVIYGICERKQIRHNLETIEEAIHAAVSMVNINLPVKIICLAEGALSGFTDEIFDLPHTLAGPGAVHRCARGRDRMAGPSGENSTTPTSSVSARARWPEVMKDRFFNTLFVIAPSGEVVHRAAKNHIWCRERSTVPHDVYDRWVELYGDGIEAFYPVLKTDDIGNIGTICCSDGEYPEAVRALAFNGAEVVYRPSEATPMTTTGYPGGGTWMIQNQGHAEFNTVYMLCPNAGPVYLGANSKHPVDIAGGSAHIVDYRGQIASYSASTNNTIVAAVVDIEALRQFRAMNLNSNWLKDLRTELFQKMYDQPIHPRNLWMNQDPKSHAEVDEIYRENIQRLYERGTWTRPFYEHEGCRFQPGGEDEPDWETMKQQLWGPWLEE